MTAPALPPPDLDWPAVLVAGLLAVHGIEVTASWAAPLGCCVGEVDCPDGHVWLATVARWARDGGPR